LVEPKEKRGGTSVFMRILRGQKGGGRGTTKSMDETKGPGERAQMVENFARAFRQRTLISIRNQKVESMAQKMQPLAFK